MWNQGLLIYNCCVAGFDMTDAEVFKYGGNITMIVRKKSIKLPDIGYCKGDVELLQPYLPDGFHHGIDGSRIEIAHHKIG